MNNLITVDFDTQMVSARELYKELGINKRFSIWFETNSQGFVEGEDFHRVYLKVQANRYGGEQDLQDYEMTIDMAKHICLMSRTEKGKQCRQYLIDLEKSWNTPEQVMARALKMADMTINKLKEHNTKLLEDNQMMKPKADYCDNVLNKNSLLTTTDIAKDLGMTARKLNSLLVQNKILYKKNGCYYTYARYDWLIEDGYADYKIYEDNYHQMLKWTEKGRKWIVENLDNWE